jgi:riboflavin synthase
MFTGIVEELGRVRAVRHGPASARLDIAASRVLTDAGVGSSISVDGVCLTAVEVGVDHWVADVVPETLTRSTLGRLRPGDLVNLERPLPANGRLGGHIVLGHVDAKIAIVDIVTLADGAKELTFELPDELALYLVEKGSVALDGVSLTITTVGPDRFGTALIPHTLAVTTFGSRHVGDEVNVEVDYLAKVVQRLAVPYIGGVR